MFYVNVYDISSKNVISYNKILNWSMKPEYWGIYNNQPMSSLSDSFQVLGDVVVIAISVIDILSLSCEIAVRWMPQDLIHL